MSGGFSRQIGRVEQQLRGLRPAEGIAASPGFEEAGRRIAAAYFGEAPPPAWLTAGQWLSTVERLRHFEAVYDEVAANATRADGGGTVGPARPGRR
jgi:hypothetical protein